MTATRIFTCRHVVRDDFPQTCCYQALPHMCFPVLSRCFQNSLGLTSGWFPFFISKPLAVQSHCMAFLIPGPHSALKPSVSFRVYCRCLMSRQGLCACFCATITPIANKSVIILIFILKSSPGFKNGREFIVGSASVLSPLAQSPLRVCSLVPGTFLSQQAWHSGLLPTTLSFSLFVFYSTFLFKYGSFP